MQGKPIDFVEVGDDNAKHWVADFTSKPIAIPNRLEHIEGELVVAAVPRTTPYHVHRRVFGPVIYYKIIVASHVTVHALCVCFRVKVHSLAPPP